MTTKHPMPRPAVSPASKAARPSLRVASPPTVTLAPPGPLEGMLAAGGYVAELVIRRADGKPMAAKDQEQAAWIVEASEEGRETSDEEVTAELWAEEDAAAAAAQKPRGKRASAPAVGKAARTAKRASAAR